MRPRGLLLVVLIATLSCCFDGFVLAPSPGTRFCNHRSVESAIALSFQEEATDDLFPADTSCSRRNFFVAAATVVASTPLFPPLGHATMADMAAVSIVDFTRQEKDFGYTVKLPETLSQPKNKPLKTHLDEVNFSGNGVNVGVTVDPVRISSLGEFGTPPEVAAKVVNAEVNRDGVVQVTLLQDPEELPDKSYVIQYLSQGKRGNKRNVCKIFVQDNKLYVLTAQAKEDDYSTDVEKTILGIVDSFQIR